MTREKGCDREVAGERGERREERGERREEDQVSLQQSSHSPSGQKVYKTSVQQMETLSITWHHVLLKQENPALMSKDAQRLASSI
eukprot:752096-Hanusia_phi.AAC.3